MYVDAYNKAANKMNNGGIEKFNKQQREKYGEKYHEREGYEDDYMKLFDAEFSKNMNKSLLDFYNSSKNYQKAQTFVNQYKMTSWDKLAQDNAAAIQSIRDALEQN